MYYFQNVSRQVLNEFKLWADTTLSGKEFHKSTRAYSEAKTNGGIMGKGGGEGGGNVIKAWTVTPRSAQFEK